MAQLLKEADALTNQRAGEGRDEALKRRMVVLKPSNKDFRHSAILFGGCNGGLGSPIAQTRSGYTAARSVSFSTSVISTEPVDEG